MLAHSHTRHNAGAVEEDGRLRTFVIYAKYLRKILRKIQWLGGCGSAVLTCTTRSLFKGTSSFRRAATHVSEGQESNLRPLAHV